MINRLSKLKKLYILSFLFSLHVALPAFVNSTFLTEFFSEKYVGLLYTIAAVITLILLSLSSTILKHFGNRRFIIGSLVINMIALIGLITSTNPYIIAIGFISLLTTNTLVFLSIDIFIEHFGNPKNIGKTRGLFLTIINLAWVISPLITGLLITQEGGYRTMYIVAFTMMMVMTIGLIFSVKTFKDRIYERTPFIKTFKYLKSHPRISSIVIINLILRFFYALMVIYTPIYLSKHIGFDWSQIGVIFTIMLTPFVILGLPVGILIDRYHIKKTTLLYIGFIIISISTLIISGVTVKNIALWSLILFFTRVGASIIETTSEVYFFTHIKEEEAYLLGVFRDMGPLSFIIAPLIGTLVFIFLPFKYIFVVVGILLLIGLHFIPKLKHDHENNIPNQD